MPCPQFTCTMVRDNDRFLGDRESFCESLLEIRFRTSFERHGVFRKSRATRRQNSSLLRRLATTKTSKTRFGQKSIFWGFGNQFFLIFPRFWRESAIFKAKINFLVKFCSRYTYSEVRATKNCEQTVCAAKTWPLRKPFCKRLLIRRGLGLVSPPPDPPAPPPGAELTDSLL